MIVGGNKRILNVFGAFWCSMWLGLFGKYLWSPSQIMRFKMADGSLMRGGSRSIDLQLAFEREIIDDTPVYGQPKSSF